MYHIFFINSSINGHIGCLHILTIIISTAMNIGVYISFLICFLYSSDRYSEEKLLSYIELYITRGPVHEIRALGVGGGRGVSLSPACPLSHTGSPQALTPITLRSPDRPLAQA